jgi:uncharacterized cupin superfamily protein
MEKPVTTAIDCPTFVDLRALAQSAPAGGSDPFGTGAQKLPLRVGPCSCSVVSLPAGSGKQEGLDADTWVLVEQGAVSLAGPNCDVELRQGQSAVIARGTQFSWRADAGARLIAMAYPGGPAGEAGITYIDNTATLSPSNPPAPEVLLGETPSCRSNNHFTSQDGLFCAGVWDSTPYQRVAIHFRKTELMHLLAGEVTFTDGAGRTATFRAGDTLIIEQGADCSWDSQVHVAKIYSQFTPAA